MSLILFLSKIIWQILISIKNRLILNYLSKFSSSNTAILFKFQLLFSEPFPHFLLQKSKLTHRGWAYTFLRWTMCTLLHAQWYSGHIYSSQYLFSLWNPYLRHPGGSKHPFWIRSECNLYFFSNFEFAFFSGGRSLGQKLSKTRPCFLANLRSNFRPKCHQINQCFLCL